MRTRGKVYADTSISVTEIQETEARMWVDSATPSTALGNDITWKELCQLLRDTDDASEAEMYLTAKGVGKWALLALAAQATGALLMLEQIKLMDEAASLLNSARSDIDQVKASQEALKACIQSRVETLAVDLLPCYQGSVPLSLIHRAGEKGMIRLLSHIAQRRIPLKPNRFLGSLTWRVRRVLRQHLGPKKLRFDSLGTELRPYEVLKWACLAYRDKGISLCMEQKLSLESESIVEILLAEGLQSTMESLIREKKLVLTDKSVLVLIQNSYIALATEVIAVFLT